jgi:hypothetical protein
VIPATRISRPNYGAGTYPFGLGKRFRPLRLLLDDDSLTEAESQALLLFAHYPAVELTRTAAAGPTDYVGRLEIGERDDDQILIWRSGPGASLSSVANAGHLRARAEAVAGSSGITPEQAYRALVHAAAVDESESDGLVTNREELLTDGSRQATIFTASEALALIGLSLRLQGDFRLGADLSDVALSESMFHFVLARELTEAGWRWFSACVASSRATGDDTAINLGETALKRLQRVLQTRDRLHAQAKSPPAPAIADELAFQFETMLLFVSAAFDATARIDHITEGGTNRDNVSWRGNRGAGGNGGSSSQAQDLVADNTPGAALLKLISRLRGTIHSEAMRPISTRRHEEDQRAVKLAQKDANSILRALSALECEPVDWGVHQDGAHYHLRVDRFAERLLPRAVALLNQLMAATRVERLAGVDPDALMTPPSNEPSGDDLSCPLSFEIRRRARLLAGL